MSVPIHPQTAKNLEQLKQNQAHAVMLTGNEGAGKRPIAYQIAADLLGGSIENKPYFLIVEPEKDSLGIDQIRQIQKFMRLKTTGVDHVRRVVIIIDAHLMTIEAQNALLKLLEEPPSDTVLILTVQGDSTLKPTIYSRVQRIHVRPITHEQAVSYAEQHGKEALVPKAYALSGGDSGLFAALLNSYDDHPLVAGITTAKEIVSATAFERLIRVDELSKDKPGLSQLLTAINRVANTGLKQAVANNDSQLQMRWTQTLQAVYDAQSNLNTSVNTKLLLSDLFLRI